ncbi:MAG: type I glutamate--ammonia ligase [Candidatus Caenarcaniphilales bacterium]|nr:type I glutamate--ammonia ligase [Candidatus Caenarcaniphilales bacterium]
MPTASKANNRQYLSDAEILEIAREKDVRLIQLQFVDLHGRPKQMTVHVDLLDKALNNEIMLDGSSIAGFRSIETSDMYFYPDKSTFQIMPWTQGGKRVGRLMCDIYNPDGTPFEGCPRNNLKRVLKKAAELGYTYNVGPELEFFLFKKNSNGDITLDTHDGAGYYDLAPDDLAEDVRSRITEVLENLGFNIEASHHEVASGQHEIDFQYSDALTTADNVINFKIVTRKIASEYGLHATFMPKPIYGINGSGMHCNQSLSDVNDGKNLFVDDNGEYKLSTKCLYYIGGLLKHIPEIVAVTNPLVNSYKRLVPGYEAPVYIAWSPSNRSALIRIPAKRGNSTRVELRSPDPSSNPYLAFAAMLTAGINGIEKQIQPPAPTQVNIYGLDEAARAEHLISSIPGSLNEALTCLKNSDIAKEALGEHIFNEFVKTKTREWDEYRTYVSQWETDKYLHVV